METAANAADSVSRALDDGLLVAPGDGAAFVTATTIDSPQGRSHA
jgi:hypothetical protein